MKFPFIPPSFLGGSRARRRHSSEIDHSVCGAAGYLLQNTFSGIVVAFISTCHPVSKILIPMNAWKENDPNVFGIIQHGKGD